MRTSTSQRKIAMLHLREVGEALEARARRSSEFANHGHRRRRGARAVYKAWDPRGLDNDDDHTLLKEYRQNAVAIGYRAECMGHDMGVGLASTYLAAGGRKNGQNSRRVMVSKLRRMERRMWWKDLFTDAVRGVYLTITTHNPFRDYQDQLRTAR